MFMGGAGRGGGMGFPNMGGMGGDDFSKFF